MSPELEPLDGDRWPAGSDPACIERRAARSDRASTRPAPESARSTGRLRRHDAHAATAASPCGWGWPSVTAIGEKLAERIVAERDATAPFRDMADLVRRAGLTAAQLEALADRGRVRRFGLSRRQALWEAGNAAQDEARATWAAR